MHQGHLYIIDVSQSVDLDHPHALEFLQDDCIHVSDFFKKHGVPVMTIHELFDFIVDPSITDESVDSYLEKGLGEVLSGDQTSLSGKDHQQQAGDIISEPPTDLVDNINSEETESDNETDHAQQQ
ncbi:hypothetical protein POM88_051197 [Heracleum sosnowskyi]|uniref:non-specific serine/threonine protein kinase n=1 Tax=Heracleum sosnowskyi TaxID=360622 RepID=A0AAD8H1T4_9APIA|nr:hypothetical protein POM88_051197 [Heracleum sosnowskyi]